MSITRSWCDTCRGDADGEALIKCAACPRKYHLACAGLRARAKKGWKCPHCARGAAGASVEATARIKQVKRAHKQLLASRAKFVRTNGGVLKAFRGAAGAIVGRGRRVKTAGLPPIGAAPAHVNATLRPYQVEGVNWIVAQYNMGVGGILGDEMGLGKTIQTLAFLATLKARGFPGPHLVITPLAVLLNWINEVRKFTPQLRVCKVHGAVSERDRILSDPAVLRGDYDVYITT